LTHRPWLLAALLGHASACTSILVPDGDDEKFVECNTVDDCDEPEDNRYVAACVRGANLSDDAPKICVADFDARGCNPNEDFTSEHPVALAYADATDEGSSALYVACTPENRGKQGCAVDLDAANPCAPGLVPTNEGICDDDDPRTPKALAPDLLIEPAGQDVLDHFCRWWMGDADWACDTIDFRCRARDDCGQIYLQGAPATTYTDLADANNDGTKSDEAITFGPIPN
jgi:hypothetical protein